MNEDVKTFIDALRQGERPRSPQTLQSYERDLLQLTAYLRGEGVERAEDVQKHQLSLYFHRLRQQGRAAATVARQMVAVRSFFHELVARGRMPSNPALGLEAPKPEKRRAEPLEQDEVERLLAAPDAASDAGARDAAMMELLYATGMRVSELAALDLEHVRLELGFIRCVDARGRERIIPVGGAAADALTAYLERVRPKLAKAGGQALFLNLQGGRMTRQGFWKILKQAARDAGIERELTPHSLRQAFAAHLLRNGADLRSVQEMMGHAGLQATLQYAQPAKTRINDVYRQAHPRAGRPT
ncbi:tyrosine recombinase [Paenibacillus sp. GCM10023250]|uniref:tyrosine recombinase n=1 Tax=Paenibacillus sp. GCM10023250 TaxID=3252648 RepID=UPI00361F2699